MDWLNFNHLFYFWTVAREGSIAKAALKLRRSQPTISAQLRLLETAAGDKLLARAGRGLQLTDHGREVFSYADEIFAIGGNLQRALSGKPQQRHAKLVVGIVNAIPKLVSYEMLRPALEPGPAPRLVVREDRSQRLLTSLALNEMDLVISDRPAESAGGQRLFCRLIRASDLAFFGSRKFAPYRKNFPKSLDTAPMLLLTDVSTYRIAMDLWFEKKKIRPEIVAEFEDSALLTVYGRNGHGIFPFPSFMSERVKNALGVIEIGRTKGVHQRYYAIASERSREYPSVRKIFGSKEGKFI